MPEFFADPVAEIMDTLAYQERRSRLQAQAAAITPDQARLISSYARTSPWIKPGVNIGLSRFGIGPNDPRAAEISLSSLLTDPRFQFGTSGDYGQEITAGQLAPGAKPGKVVGGVGYDAAKRRYDKRQEDRELLASEGWRSMDEILAEHPELKAVVQGAGLVVKDGVVHRPRNTSTDKGRAFTRLASAFGRAGVDLPFINDDTAHEDQDGRLGVLVGRSDRIGHAAGSYVWIDDELAPPDPTSQGGGQFPGMSGAMATLPTPAGTLGPGRRPDPIMQERLRQAGLNIDWANPASSLSFITRPATLAMDAPLQELQGQFRNAIAATDGRPVNWTESQSDLGIMLGAAHRGQTLDTGNGFFLDPESEVAKERRSREMARGQIGRHSITIGRWLADTVTEPDTTPFNVLSGTVDAGVQLADPTSYGLGKAGNVRKARSLFEAADTAHDAAGLVNGVRRALHGPTAAAWLDSDAGIASLEALAGEGSPARIWAAMGRRIDPRLAARFADAADTPSVRGILEELLGPHIRTPAELEAAATALGSGRSPLDGALSGLNPRHSRSRLMNWMPGTHLDTQDPRQFATHLERHLINAKVPTPLIEEVINDVARSETANGMFQAALKAMRHEQGVLVQNGVSKENARLLTTLYRDHYQTSVDELIDEIGDDAPIWTKILNDGEVTDLPGPHLPLEHVGRYIPLPEARRIRRLTSNPALRFLTTSRSPNSFGQNRLPIAGLDFITQEIWKSTTLLGRFPAWISRVVGESQLRMAAGGLDSMFRHPIDFFAYAVGRKGGISPAGISLDDIDEFRSSLSKAHGGWISRPGAVRSSRPVIIPNDPEFATQFRDAWADELSLLSHDPLARFLLQNGAEETERWLMVGQDGQRILRTLREGHPGALADSPAIQEYIQSVSRRITLHTGGDARLVEAIKTGKYDNIPLMSNTNRTNPQFSKALESHLDVAPARIKGHEFDMRRAGTSFPERVNNAVDWMFAQTMGRADNWWDRAPTFKQYLWQHTAELMPFADARAQVSALRNARKANLPSRLIKRMEKAAQRHTEDGLSIEELDFLARGYAADSSKKLLFDLAERGQLADAARIIAPFGNAYQEIFSAWGNLLTDLGGPGAAGRLIGAARILRRSQQIIEGARGEDFGSVVGAPAGEGFFFKDEYDQEVFVIPGTQWLTQAATGVPVPLTGSVQGLNMVGNVIPGLGPAAAIPVAWIIQDKPQLNGIHDLLLPYGAPGERQRSDITQLLNYAPPWTRRMFDALTGGGYDQRLWANTQKDTMAYLASTGEYDLSTRAGLQELTTDAKAAARRLYMIRGGAQFFAPTTPSFRFLIEDKTGALLATQVVVEDYWRLQEAEYETATENFMALYGEDAVLSIIPKSGASTYGIPRNQEQLNFVLNNPDIKNNFPSTYGFFLPQPDDPNAKDAFDYEVYLRSFTEGEREDISADQWLALANSMRGDMLFQKYKDMVGDRTDKAARDWLGNIRRQIMELFPTGPTGLPEKPDTDQMIMELYQAMDNDAVRATDAGRGLAMYFQYRDQAQAAAEALGRSSFAQSNDTEYLREWLNEVSEAVIAEHPDFQFVWDIVLSREARLEEDRAAAA